jgi:hypothetical protein
MMPESGAAWVAQFPTSNKVADLEPTFQPKVTAFLSALAAAGAHVSISATLRPPQRAYMMHYSWSIVKQHLNPATIPAYVPTAGAPAPVDIQWVHADASGNPDPAGSTAGALAMVQGYGIAGLGVPPALSSRHMTAQAIDMDISWTGSLTINNASGNAVTIASVPRSGINPDLIKLGATYGVIHLLEVMADQPHWSTDGH